MSKFVLICCQEIAVKIMKKYDKNIRFISINMESASHILDLIAPDIDFVCMLLLLLSMCLSIFFSSLLHYSLFISLHCTPDGRGMSLWRFRRLPYRIYFHYVVSVYSDRGGKRANLLNWGYLGFLDSNRSRVSHFGGSERIRDGTFERFSLHCK